MMQPGKRIRLAALALLSSGVFWPAAPVHAKSKESAKKKAEVVLTIDSVRPHCQVDIDSLPVGMTGIDGKFSIRGIQPGDHYVHVGCPGQPEVAYFISPQPGERVQFKAVAQPPLSPLEAAQARAQLRRIVLRADQLRSGGQSDEAVKLLREATKLDRSNADLHRELGITFLLDHEWEQAKVEMLEAIRHDPGDAEAHGSLGYALEKLGDLDAALKQYRICAHIDPQDPSYQEHYVEVLAAIAARQEAAKH